MELKHAVLGLLSIQPMSGYDLGKALAGSVAHFWYADQSQVYRVIDRLTADGMLDTEVVPQDGRPDRKVHSLTQTGRDELGRWLHSPLEVERPKIPLLARLFFIAPLGREAAEDLLDRATARARDELDRLRLIDIGPTDDMAGALRAATLDYGLRAAEAELDWLRTTRDRLAQTGEDHGHDH